VIAAGGGGYFLERVYLIRGNHKELKIFLKKFVSNSFEKNPKNMTAAQLGDGKIVLGTMRLTEWGGNLDTAAITEVLRAARDAGVTCIDLADIYGNHTVEAAVGDALRADPTLADAFKFATKFGILFPSAARPDIARKAYDSSREHALASVDRSNKLLFDGVGSGGRVVDLVMVHRPDYLVHPRELAATLAELVSSGRAAAVGVSNYGAAQLRTLHAELARLDAGVCLAVNQVRACSSVYFFFVVVSLFGVRFFSFFISPLTHTHTHTHTHTPTPRSISRR
jgi:predicted oxidoreductase